MVVTTSAATTMMAVMLAVSTVMAAVPKEMAEKSDPGGDCVLQQIHSLFWTRYSILEYTIRNNGEWWQHWWRWLWQQWWRWWWWEGNSDVNGNNCNNGDDGRNSDDDGCENFSSSVTAFLNNIFHFGIRHWWQWQVVPAVVTLDVTTGVAEVKVRWQHLWQWQELGQWQYDRGSDDNGCNNFSSGNNDGSDVGGVNNYCSSGGRNGWKKRPWWWSCAAADTQHFTNNIFHFWNRPSAVKVSGGGSGGGGCDNSGGSGDGERATEITMSTTATTAMAGDVNNYSSGAGRNGWKRDPGGGHVMQQIHSLYQQRIPFWN
jgi:hypothetical protein